MRNYRICYSLNLAAFIAFKTGQQPDVIKDSNGLYYCVYPESQEIRDCLTEWKNPDLVISIHDYLNKYAEIRKAIAAKRREDSGEEA